MLRWRCLFMLMLLSGLLPNAMAEQATDADSTRLDVDLIDMEFAPTGWQPTQNSPRHCGISLRMALALSSSAHPPDDCKWYDATRLQTLLACSSDIYFSTDGSCHTVR